VKLLGMERCGWDELGHGRNGYRKGLYFASISILYDGNPGMGTCLDMSGQGCRSFEEYGTGDFDGLFRLFQQGEGYHVTRLDVAFDDHSGILDIQQLFRDSNNQDGGQQFVSKFRKSRIEKEFKDGRPGITVYHGSKKSAVLIRIYDRAAEQDLPEDQHWVRVELQLRDERAEAFCFDPAPIGVLFRGVLVNYVRYVDDPGTDSNRWRWPMKDYWENLIEQVGRIRLYVKPGIEYNIRQLDTFVFEQAGNAISAAVEIYGAPFFLRKIQERNISENPKYRRLVEQYGKNKPKVCTPLGPSDEVHRAIPWGQFLGEAGKPRPGYGGTPGRTGPGLEPAPGADFGQAPRDGDDPRPGEEAP
jgi:hypothetical protein